MEKKEKRKRLVIIDANAVIHRAFHALPALKTKKGEIVNAVYGFLLVFLKTIKEFKPEFIAAAFDFPAPTLRHIKYKLYKANRVKAPDELYEQIPKVKQILKEFNVPVFEKEGYEADDIIGTLSKKMVKKQIYPKLEVVIVSGDADVLQLVDENIKAYILKKGVKDIVLYDGKKVEEKYQGLSPAQLVDFKALRGDPSDNIPGVKGIGEKGAIELIKKFGSLENIYKALKENDPKFKEIKNYQSLKEKLIQSKEQAFVSKMLAEINKNTPLDFNLEICRWGNYDKEKIIKVLKNYDFKSLVARLDEKISSQQKQKEIKKRAKEKKEIKNNLKLW